MIKLKPLIYVMPLIIILPSCSSKLSPSNEIVAPPAILLSKPYDLQSLLDKIISVSSTQSITTKQ